MEEEDRRRIGERGHGRQSHAGHEEARQFEHGWRGGLSEQDWAQREEFGGRREYGRGYDRDEDYGQSGRYRRQRDAGYYDEPESRGGGRSYRDWNDPRESGRGYGRPFEEGGYGGGYGQDREQYGQPEGGRGYEQTYGQGHGQYSGRGPKGYTRSDDRIKEDVCDRLTDDADVDASNIEVSARNCEVTLSGTVDTREAKRRAEDCAESVSGVRHVQNNLRVQESGSRTSAASGNPDAGTRASGSSGGKRSS